MSRFNRFPSVEYSAFTQTFQEYSVAEHDPGSTGRMRGDAGVRSGLLHGDVGVGAAMVPSLNRDAGTDATGR